MRDREEKYCSYQFIFHYLIFSANFEDNYDRQSHTSELTSARFYVHLIKKATWHVDFKKIIVFVFFWLTKSSTWYFLMHCKLVSMFRPHNGNGIQLAQQNSVLAHAFNLVLLFLPFSLLFNPTHSRPDPIYFKKTLHYYDNEF